LDEGGEDDHGDDAKPPTEDCDLVAVKQTVSARCSSCHGGGAKLGGFSIDGHTEWTPSTPELALAIAAMQAGTMPPPVSGTLTPVERDVVRVCVEKAAPVPRDISCPEDAPAAPSLSASRRLSKAELTNTLTALLGTSVAVGLADTLALLPDAVPAGGFSSQTVAAGTSHVDAYFRIAEAASTLAVADDTTRSWRA
jgi:hypothetical protein